MSNIKIVKTTDFFQYLANELNLKQQTTSNPIFEKISNKSKSLYFDGNSLFYKSELMLSVKENIQKETSFNRSFDVYQRYYTINQLYNYYFLMLIKALEKYDGYSIHLVNFGFYSLKKQVKSSTNTLFSEITYTF